MTLKLNLSIFLLFALLAAKSIAAEDAITVGEVSKISLDDIGIITEKQGGLSHDLWKGGNRPFIETLLVKTSTIPTSEVAKDLRKRLLLSSAAAPQITSQSSLPLFDLRLKLLAQTGDAANIAKFIAAIPPDRITEPMQQIHVASLFISDDYPAACAKNTQMQGQYKSVFWRQAMIICKAFEKKKADVELSTTLLKEDGTEISPEFIAATSGLIKDGSGKKDWNAILQKTVIALPPVENQLPVLAKNQTALPADKLAAKLKEIEKLEKPEQLVQLAKIYATLESLGTPISKAEWQAFLAYAIANDIQPPAFVIAKLLGNTKEPLSKGEKILLIIHSLSIGAKKIPADLLVQITGFLHENGMADDAKKLAEEGIL